MVATATPEMKRNRLETEQRANRKKLRLNKRADANCQSRLFNQQKKAPQEASSGNDDSRMKRKFRDATNSINIKSVAKRSLPNRRRPHRRKVSLLVKF